MNTIRRYAAEDAHIIYGAAYDETLGDRLRVTVIATGLSSSRRQQAPISVVHSAQPLRTGTDGIPVLNQVANTALAGAMAAQDFSNANIPSVWRTNRTQAAARVEALSSNGMDEIEIPAFLRKQAD